MNALVAIRPPQRGLPKGALTQLRGLPRAELGAFVGEQLGGPAFRGDQVFEWIHRHRVDDFERMTNLAKADRVRLGEVAETGVLAVDVVLRGADGTRKLRLRTADGESLECVLIPNPRSRPSGITPLRGSDGARSGRGLTLCISSMVGCSLTCRFCATATLGFVRNLAAWEIVDQVYRAQELLAGDAAAAGATYVPRIGNLVLMGMGEPLHNFGQVQRALQVLTDERGAAIAGRRITVSTAGLVPGIERFAREGLAAEVGLAVSLNATTDAVRDQIMPINTRWPIAELLAAVRDLPQPKRRRVTFEYVLLADVNDTDDDARRLAALVGDLHAKVNAIPFNPHEGATYRRPAPERIDRFVELVRRGGVEVHVRTPRGDDIGAACGQLALTGGGVR
jgi:23S rRNA (adenine2503-C2)-methyltransferase